MLTTAIILVLTIIAIAVATVFVVVGVTMDEPAYYGCAIAVCIMGILATHAVYLMGTDNTTNEIIVSYEYAPVCKGEVRYGKY